MTIRRPLVLLALLALGPWACGPAEEAGDAGEADTAAPATGGDTLDLPLEGADEPYQRVVVQAASFAFQPSAITVAPGRVRFIVTNAAEIAHGFEVEGQGLEEAIHEIAPGTTDSLDVRLEVSGEYEIYCPVGDHAGQGMVGTLTVAPTGP